MTNQKPQIIYTMDLLIAILIAINSILTPSAVYDSSLNTETRIKEAKYILENNLYRVNNGGVIIDPDVSL